MTPDRSLPTGTVTFLFSDIEGSTRLVQRFGDRYPDILERHQEILRSAFATHEGTEVATEGDSFFVAFRTAAQAVAAALAARRSLEAHPWPDDARVRVRMGIHTGEGVLGAGSYVGIDVHRAARIAAAGHGGQILISDTTRTLLQHAHFDGIIVRDLGVHRLKDLLEAERIHQVDDGTLESEFPPLATLTSQPNNLPTQMSTFLGRDDEMRAVCRALTDGAARLVTLTGPGGIGKTRLALQAAAELSGSFEDGVFFVDLSPVRESDSAFEAMVLSIGEPRSAEPAFEQLERSLENKRLLLLLDNLEQVIDVATGIVALIRRCPGLHVLATSREALRVRGERVVPVPPLALASPTAGEPKEFLRADAVRLFLERAQETNPAFDPTNDDLRAVAEICVRLDGLPLAIELAAARLNLFSPRDLRDRLHERIDALGRGARDLPARQRTLRSTIEWSYELLEPDERATFRLFSVFPSARPGTIEAVASEIDELRSLDVLAMLDSLLDKSLVRPTEDAADRRLTMLQTIREYASERLREDPLGGTIERAHAEYFATFAFGLRDRVHGSERVATLDHIEAELGNLMAAWRCWLDVGDLERLDMLLDALWVLHDARGWYQGAVELTNGLLGALGRSPSSPERSREEITLRTSLARGLMAIRGYTPEVEETYNRALALVYDAGGLPERIPVLRSLASLYMYRGEFDRCLEVGRQLLRLAEQQHDPGLQAEGHIHMGTSLLSLGDAETGLEHLEVAAALFDPERHGTGRFHLGPSPGVTPHTTLAFVRWGQGYADRARAHAALALEIAERIGQPYTLAYARFHVGLLNVWERRWDRVQELASEVLEIARSHDYHVWEATALVLHGVATTTLNRHDDGVAESDRGVALYQEMSAPPVFWPLLQSLRAMTLANVGRYAEALDAVDEAIGLMRGPPNLLAAQFPVLRGHLLVWLGDPTAAVASYEVAVDIARLSGARMNELRATIALAGLATEADARDALERLRRVYGGFTEGFDAPDLVEARKLLER